MISIYIGDDLLDLALDTKVATTFKTFNIGDLKSRGISYTNIFKLPKTNTNNTVLANANLHQSSGTKPYEALACKVLNGGIPLIKGVLIILEVNTHYNVAVYESSISFFDSLGDQVLNELDYTSVNSAWNFADLDTLRNTTSGVLAAVMDWGYNLYTSAGQIYIANGPSVRNSKYTVPCFYYHDIIDKIITEAGYTKSGAVFSDALYIKMLIAGERTTQTYTDLFHESVRFSASGIALNVYTAQSTSFYTVPFPTIGFNGTRAYYENVAYTYDVTNTDTAALFFSNSFRTQVDITVTGGGTVDVRLRLWNGSVYSTLDSVTNIGTGVYNLAYDNQLLNDGDFVVVDIRPNVGTSTVTLNYGLFYSQDAAAASETYTYFNEILPIIKKKDFLKDFMLMFGLLVKEENNVLTFKGIDEIINDRASAVDWTTKRVKREDKMNFTFYNYGRTNLFRYKESNDEINLLFIGEGAFTIPNTNLEKERVTESIYSNTITKTSNNIFCASATIFDPIPPVDFIEDISPGRRILLARDPIGAEPSVVFNTTPRSDYKVAYFEDSRVTNSCSYQYFLDSYYTQFIDRISNTKVIEREYILTDVDIAKLDLFLPVFDDGYYMILEVTNYISGLPTKVSLLKI